MYVEMRDICKNYGNFRASDHVSFGIEKGKLVALLGPSGSGKPDSPAESPQYGRSSSPSAPRCCTPERWRHSRWCVLPFPSLPGS